MLLKINLILLTCLFFNLFHIAYAQTIGLGEVTSIESKAASYESNKSKIKRYQAELPEIEALWKKRTQKLRDELAALYIERDNLIADMKAGARCSQCNVWKSEFEKKGINFQQHLGEVKGYAVPATTAELEAIREKYRGEIAYKKVQIQDIEKGNNPVAQKINSINALEKDNETLCNQISNHSKNYEEQVFLEAKNNHEIWMNYLINYATNILISDDKITISKAKTIRDEKEFQKESIKVKERVKKENSEKQANNTNQIVIHIQKIKDIQSEQVTYLEPLLTKVNNLKNKLNLVNADLKKPNLLDSIKIKLIANQKQLSEDIVSTEKNITDYNVSVQKKLLSLEQEVNRLKNENFLLATSLTKQQAQEIAKIKIPYDQKKLEESQFLTKTIAELARNKKLYSEKATFYKKQNADYLGLVVSETDRMTMAGQKINCPIWKEIRFKVAGNWSQVFPCVDALTRFAKPYSAHGFNLYCAGTSSASYMASYKRFISELSDVDREAVKGNTNITWFNLITK